MYVPISLLLKRDAGKKTASNLNEFKRLSAKFFNVSFEAGLKNG